MIANSTVEFVSMIVGETLFSVSSTVIDTLETAVNTGVSSDEREDDMVVSELVLKSMCDIVCQVIQMCICVRSYSKK